MPGQSLPVQSTFYPAFEHSYGIKDGIPDLCISKSFNDSLGHLHLVSCASYNPANRMYVYEFDGMRSFPSTLGIDKTPHIIIFEEVDVSGRFYGFYHFMQTDGTLGSAIFNYNPVNKITWNFPLDNRGGRVVNSVKEQDNMLYVLTYESATLQYEILSVQDASVRSGFTFKGNKKLTITAPASLAITADAYWVAESSDIVYRISRETGELQEYTLPVAGQRLSDNVKIIAHNGKDIWVQSKGIFRLDTGSGTFVRNPFKPANWKEEEITRHYLSADRKGNLLVGYQFQNNRYSATLIDGKQLLYDYSPVMSEHHSISGNDFKRGIIAHTPGLRCVEVRPGGAIKQVTGIGNVRDIIQLDKNKLNLTAFEGMLEYVQGEWRKSPGVFPCTYKPTFRVGSARDSKGRTWYVAGQDRQEPGTLFVRYHAGDGSCQTFQVNLKVQRFDLLDDDRIVLATSDRVYLFNTQTGEERLLSAQPVEGFVNQVLAGPDSVVWVAKSSGLLKTDIRTGKQQLIQPVKGMNVNVLSIHQDGKGRLWLGTFFQGTIMYDPRTGETAIIDTENGLSNNTVATILEDNDGIMWAGTFYGINLLTPEGVVLGKVFKEDGLVDNECNRWSSLKMDDGRLCFGTPFGISIIDPALFKAQLKSIPAPQIFLQSLYSDAAERNPDTLDHLAAFRQNKLVVLPAQYPNLKIAFVLSNYASPETSQFSYKIEGYMDDWFYIGNQRHLALNNLPAGQYRIFVRGTDSYGVWSEPPVEIQVKVQRIFYKQWWFYVLCSLPFVAIFILWQLRQQQERKKLEQEVLDRTAIIREQSEKLMEMDQVKSRLYTNITHEFRTPLTVIMGMTERMSELHSEGEEKEHTDIIRRNSANLLNLVNQMLDLQKLEAGAMPLNLVQDDIVGYVRYIAESFRSLAGAKSIHFRLLTDLETFLMDFDPEKLRQVLANLLSNAIKFTLPEGEIYLHLDYAESEACLHIKVRDTGAGIQEDELPKIFERFYQVDDSSTRKGEGTGIGLTLAAELVKIMGGTISVVSHPGRGSTFDVGLPVRNEAPQTQETAWTVPETMVLPFLQKEETDFMATDGREKEQLAETVLIVEDNADVVQYLAMCLKHRYNLLIAMNGQEGIDMALENVPDLIVSDVMMPVKDGFELLETLKQDERTSHIPIVMLTAKADFESRLAGISRGADAYLSKPFQKQELLVIMEQLMALRKKLQARYSSLQLPAAGVEEDLKIEHAFLQKFREAVLADLDNEDLDAPALSRSLGMSRMQLHRKIKALTGQSTMELLRQVRLEKSKELLRDPGLNISQVAYATGFRYAENFSRSFQEAYGASPSDWRKAQGV